MSAPLLIKWFPPSWFQIKAGDHITYFDPAYLRTNFTGYAKKIEYSKWPDPIDGLPEELEPADIILISHHHKDHCKKGTVDRLRNERTRILATKACSKELGPHITLVKAGIKICEGNLTITAVEAYNRGQEGRKRLMHKKGSGVGYVISIEGKRIYHAGDTDIIPEMNHIRHIDVALLPIGGRGFTMDLHDAVEAAKTINPKVIIPMHRFASDPVEYKTFVEKDSSIRVVPLGIGETYRV